MLIYKVRNFFEFVLGGRNLFEIDAEFFRHPFWLSKFFCRSLYSRKNYTMHCRKNSVERKTPCRKNSVVILVFYPEDEHSEKYTRGLILTKKRIVKNVFRVPPVLGSIVKNLEKAMVLSKGCFIGPLKVISGLFR